MIRNSLRISNGTSRPINNNSKSINKLTVSIKSKSKSKNK